MTVSAPESAAVEPQGQAEGTLGADGGQTIDFGGDIGSVSFEEARNGYLRHADYTRKTQELAAQRQHSQMAQQLVDSLDAQPEQTLRAIAEAYGIQGFAQAQQQQQDDLADLPEPVANRLRQAEQQLQQMQQWQQQQARQAAEAQMNQQLEQVKGYSAQMGLPYDEGELLQFAYKNNLFDLQAAYLRMNSEKLLPAAKQAVHDAMAAKRGLVAQRSGVNTAGSKSNVVAKPKSIRDALGSALEEAGLSDLSQVDFS